MKKIFLLASLLIITTLQSCDLFTTPESPEPGRRDYVWRADTLNLVMNDFRSIWGSGPDDVWVGTFQYREIFHYDGEKWTKHKEVKSSSEAMFGFAKNNVWTGGNDGRIWHYDGETWYESFRYIDEKFKFAKIRAFWGERPNDLYAIGVAFIDEKYNKMTNGQRAFILHYNGIQWEEEYYTDFQSQFIRIRKNNDKYVISNIISDNMGNGAYEFYEYHKEELKNIYSILMRENKIAFFNNIGKKVLFNIDNEVFTYDNNEFNKRLTLLHPSFGSQIYGRTEKDIFVRMEDGLGHYNGEDIQYLCQFGSNWTNVNSEALILENDVFFLVSDYSKRVYFILHGTLKE